MQEQDRTKPIAKLALEDGSVYVGRAFGARGTTAGEVVFNTSMTGYQEIITDPSYCGQIIAMTYPEIGNYGFNHEDFERARPALAGFVVRNASPIASNYRSVGLLEEFLQQHGVIGISDLDTRALVRKIRTLGALRGVISSEQFDDADLIHRAQSSPSLVGRDLVREVVPANRSDWNERLHALWSPAESFQLSAGKPREFPSGKPPGGLGPVPSPHVVALDFGMKWNIARHLASQGFRVTILPGTSSARAVLDLNPDGVFLSNGPGDPEPLAYAIETIRQLLGKLPLFGICLGHQLLGLACGAKTFKLKFGHRGANQPVLNIETNKVEITSQNHGFSVSDEELPEELIVTHRNLNDDTIAGLRHRHLPAFSVQYHPEASAGPHDSQYLFDQFRESLKAAAAV